MSGKHPSVLLVEDEKLLSWSLVHSLSKWGFCVHPVVDGRAAIEALARDDYDFVLLDYRLPDVDGIEVARRARAARPDATIFLLSACEPTEIGLDPRLIDRYFNKPIDLAALRRALDGVQAHRGPMRG